MFLYPVGNLSPGGVNVDVKTVLGCLDSNLIAFPGAILVDVLVWFSIALPSVCKEQVTRYLVQDRQGNFKPSPYSVVHPYMAEYGPLRIRSH
jgi:hypothetical protein